MGNGKALSVFWRKGEGRAFLGVRAPLILRLSIFWDLVKFFFFGFMSFFFNIMLMWKIVEASKASVLYIYIEYID